MNSTISCSRFLAGAMCVLVLAGCDSIKDVPEEPFANLPTPLTVVSGTITGLGSRRSITVKNNGDIANALVLTAPNPTAPGEQITPFSFGGIKQGQPYHIEVDRSPFGKHCYTTDEGSPAQGTVGTASVNVVIRCDNDTSAIPGGRRYNLTVGLPNTRSLFIDLPESKVRLTTEEQIYELDLAAIKANPSDPNYASLMDVNDPKVTFTEVLVNATGQPNAFPWLVGATTKEGGRINKCNITNASNTVGTTTTNSTGDVNPVPAGTAGTGPRVGTSAGSAVSPCQFTIGGRVGYSQPVGTVYTPQSITGLKLELRNTQNRPVGNLGVEFEDSDDPESDPKGPKQYLVPDCNNMPTPAVTVLATAGAQAAVNGTNFGCGYTLPYTLRSNSSAVYDVVVAQHPDGMRCLVAKGGGAVLFVANPTTAAATNSNAANITNMDVICRTIPTDPAKLLTGVYRLKSQTRQTSVTSTPVTVSWRPFNRTVQNHATSAMLSFFDDGTFLYGTHNNDAGTQVEHGFYDYDPNANTGFSFRVGGVYAVGATNYNLPGVGTQPATVTLTGNYSGDSDAANVAAAIAAQVGPGITVGFSGTSVTFTANTTGIESTPMVVLNGLGVTTSELTPGSDTAAAMSKTGPMNLDFSKGGRLSFSLVVDTNNSQTFPATFSNANNTSATSSTSGTPGISASFGSPRQSVGAAGATAATTTYVTDPTMREVRVSTAGLYIAEVDDNGNTVVPEGVPPLNTTVRTITGKWGAAGTAAAGPIPATTTNSRLDWILEEPPHVDQELTGTWISQDHRRLWVWDFRTYYGFAVGVVGGGPSINDACFTLADVRQHSGLYTRRGTISGCYPFNRPSNDPNPFAVGGASYVPGFQESIQHVVMPAINATALSAYTQANSGQLPGFVGFIPGGVSAASGSPPSPSYFHIAPPDSFFSTASTRLFPPRFPFETSPATDLSWCDTEVLGMRTTTHDIPINYPVYFCRAKN